MKTRQGCGRKAISTGKVKQRMKTNHPQPEIFEIRLQGHLGEEWTSWFEGMTITLTEDGDTVLTGPVVDQAALHGILKKVRDLGLTLISVNPCEMIVETDK